MHIILSGEMHIILSGWMQFLHLPLTVSINIVISSFSIYKTMPNYQLAKIVESLTLEWISH